MWSETLELTDVRIISTYAHAGRGQHHFWFLDGKFLFQRKEYILSKI